MRSFLTTILSACCLLAANEGARPLTADERKQNHASLELIWSTVRDQHWDPKLGGVDWQAARATALIEIEKARTAADGRNAMQRLLDRLGKSHFAIIPGDLYKEIDSSEPGSQTGSSAERNGESAQRRSEDWSPGIEAGVVDGVATVVGVLPGYPAARAGVLPGWTILSIDEEETKHLIDVSAGVALKERERIQVGMLVSRLEGPPKEKVEVVFLDGAGRKQALSLERIIPRGTLAKFGNLPETRVWLEARRLPGDIGYVRFNMFLDPENLMPEFEKAVKDCLKCKGFIVDLRGNPGGIGAMAMGMAGWFFEESGRRLGTLSTRDSTFRFEIFPRPQTFEGRLAVLIDGGSASTSEILAGGLQDLKRARVFGTRSAGAALPSIIIKLPNGDGFQFANANYVSQSGKILEGVGVTPDVMVRHTRRALLSGRDAVVDAAAAWIGKQ